MLNAKFYLSNTINEAFQALLETDWGLPWPVGRNDIPHTSIFYASRSHHRPNPITCHISTPRCPLALAYTSTAGCQMLNTLIAASLTE